ncbi:MAG: HEAT repeat domain-containing protein [Sedimentisphaerales bacterium]
MRGDAGLSSGMMDVMMNNQFRKMLGIMIRRAYFVILLLLAGCQQGATKVDSNMMAPTAETSPRVETDTQLKVNQESLLRGATEDVRLDAATVMLFSDSTRARQVLIETLKQSENKQARMAVCRALTVSRETRRPVRNKNDFIEPLANVLKTEEGNPAKFAAEALLIFDYDAIANVLEPMAKDESMPVKARLNAIYAMKVQLDIKAITRVAELVEDKDKQVSVAAGDALRSLGIPVSRDARRRAQILSDLRTNGMERFQRDWLIRQESRVNDLEKERDQWRKLYLGSLDRIYEGLGEEGQRGKFLIEQLNNSESMIRLWALDKVSQWRIGTQSKLPAELGPVLVKLVSSDNRDVRLATAKLLSLTGELSSAERLAEQFKVEQDEEVKTELFVALGAACHYALVPTSGSQLSPELRRQTLEWAAGYLNDEDAKKAHRGAEVIRKLLEPGGLAADDVVKYMDMLVERYGRDKGNGALRGDLLGTMARLCGQNVYKPESAKRFAGLFEQALSDESDLVREAAVDGLICVDRPRALKLLAKDFVSDRSQIVRDRVMELAGEVGGKDDLSWLWDKLGANSEGKTAWQAMLKIFNNCDVNVIESWIGRFDSQAGKGKLSDEQCVSFFELAERKAVAENKAEIVRATREKLALLYTKAGQFEQAAEYLGKLRGAAKTAEQKEAILGQLVDVYLRWPKVEAATQIVGNCLLEKDLGNDSAVIRSIDAFLDNPSEGSDPNMVLKSLRRIKSADQRPLWHQHLARWGKRFGPAKEAEDPNSGG